MYQTRFERVMEWLLGFVVFAMFYGLLGAVAIKAALAIWVGLQP